MSIYAISDLHLSFNTDKPMNIFGWDDYENRIAEDWNKKVSDEDLVLLPGDFSWELRLQNTYKDFEYLSNLPGKKLLLKGIQDYWWTTLKSMRDYLKQNNYNNIDFITKLIITQTLKNNQEFLVKSKDFSKYCMNVSLKKVPDTSIYNINLISQIKGVDYYDDLKVVKLHQNGPK